MIIQLGNFGGGGGTGSGVTPSQVNALINSAITQGQYINDAEYISSAKTIVLYQDSTEVATIDATAFIKDGMVDSVTVSGSVLTIVFNTDAGKEPINVDLSSIVDLSNYWTSAQTQSAINSAVSGKQDTLTAGSGISISSANIISVTASTGGSNIIELTQSEYDALVSGGTVDPDALYIITDASEVNLSGYAESSAVTAEIAAAVSGKQDTLISGTNIKTINNQSLLGSGNIDIQGGGGATYSAGTNISIDTANTINCTLPITETITQYARQHNLQVWYNNNTFKDSTFQGIIIGSKNNITGSTAFVVGDQNYSRKNSEAIFGFGNDANGIRAFISGYYNTTNNGSEAAFGQYNNSVTGSTASGQTLFSVGNGSSTSARHNAFEIKQNGDIYVNDGTNDVKLQDTITGTAANTTALGGLKFVRLTQAQYDALVTKDADTMYIIVSGS